MAAAPAEMAASKPPVAILLRKIDTLKGNTMKMLQVSNLTMDPALWYSMHSSKFTSDIYCDSYHGSVNFCLSEYRKQHSGIESTNSPYFEFFKVPLKKENSDGEEPSGSGPPTQKTALSKSVMSDLLRGIDLIYGHLPDEERMAEQWQKDNETASFNPAKINLKKTARLDILVQKLQRLPKVENDEEKAVTEATHQPDLFNEMDETNTHGRTFRPKEEETPRRYSCCHIQPMVTMTAKRSPHPENQ